MIKNKFWGTAIFLLIFAASFAQTYNVQLRVTGLRHNYDCGNDGATGDQPDPRWRIWGGYSGANFTQYTGAVANCSGTTIERSGVSCGLVNDFSPFNIVNLTGTTATQVNAEMQCWEEDACSDNCSPNNCFFNDDDIQSGQARIANINYQTYAPCSWQSAGTFYRDATNGYGADFQVYWEYVTITPGSISASQTICSGADPASLSSVTGASAFTFYQWQSSTDNITWSDIGGANASTYDPPILLVTTYYRRKASTCTAPVVYSNTVTITVNQVSTDPASATASSTILCGAGTVNLTVNGGLLQPSDTWTWYAGGCASGAPIGTGATLSNVAVSSSTDFFVRAEGACGNTNCQSVTVNVGTPSTAPTSITTATTTICQGQTATLTVAGGSLGSGAQWNWYSSSCGAVSEGTGNSINVTPSTTTTYFVRAGQGCNTTTCAQLTVNVNTNSTDPTAASSNPTGLCGTGTIDLSVSGGSLGTGASWVWYQGVCGTGTQIGTGATLTGVNVSSSTSFYVRAEGVCNNSNCENVTVNVGSASTDPTSATTSLATVCQGTSVTLSVNGGSLGAGAQWQWYANACGTGTSVGTGASISVTPNSTTTYYVKGEGGCYNTICQSVTVNVENISTDPTTATASQTALCGAGTVNLSVSGGSLGTAANWVWYENACATGTPIGTGAILNNVNISLTTTYYVRAEGSCNNSNCQSVAVAVSSPSTNPTSASVNTDTICAGATATLSVNGGSLGTSAAWEWYSNACGTGVSVGTGASINVIPTTTTTYYVRGEGGCGNTNCQNVMIVVNTPSTDPTAANTSAASICSGGNATLSVSGGSLGTGATWQWYAGGCGSGTVIGTGTSITVNPTSTQTYYVRAEGACGNTNCLSVSVNVNSISSDPTSAIASVTSVCPGGNVILTVSGGTLGSNANWEWYQGSCGGISAGSGNSVSVSPSSNTTYYVRAEGPCGNTNCSSVTINVGTGSIAPTSASVLNGFICPGDTSTLYLTGGNLAFGDTWVWYTGSCGAVPIGVGDSLKVTPTSSTTYYVRAVGTCGNTSCQQTTVNVSPGSIEPASVIASKNNFCPGDSTTLTLSGGSLGTGSAWYWYENQCGGTIIGTGTSIVVQPTNTTNYYVRAEGGSCGNTACIGLSVNILEAYAYFVPFDTLCGIGSPFQLNGGLPPGGTYSGTGVTGSVFNPIIAGVGTHTVNYTIIAPNGCVAQTSSNLTINQSNITANFSVEEKICSEGGVSIEVNVSGGTGTYNYYWSNGEATQEINYVQPGTYQVSVVDGAGCAATISNIEVTTDLGCLELTNAFTPNGDGVNDSWNVNLSVYTSPNLQIFSKWGQLIYEKDGITHVWDGKFKGENVPAGTYYYIIKYNGDKAQTGPITIVR